MLLLNASVTDDEKTNALDQINVKHEIEGQGLLLQIIEENSWSL